MNLNNKVRNKSHRATDFVVNKSKLFPNYGESPQRPHPAGICLQMLDLSKFLIPDIALFGDPY